MPGAKDPHYTRFSILMMVLNDFSDDSILYHGATMCYISLHNITSKTMTRIANYVQFPIKP